MRLLVQGLMVVVLVTVPVDAPVSLGSDGHGLLDLGIRQYQDGDFEAAVFALDTAIGTAGRSGETSERLARAYVYLGAAFVGLNNEFAARGKFRKAIELSPGFTLESGQFPESVVRLFKEESLERSASRNKRRAKIFLLSGVLGAGAAVGVGTAVRPEQPNTPPVVALTVTPPGLGIASATAFSFTAVARDVNLDPLSFRWDFGDGSQPSESSAATISRVFEREGSFTVTVTVTDPSGGSSSASASVSVGTLTGEWFAADDRVYLLTQVGPDLNGRRLCPNRLLGECTATITGRASHPRHVTLNYADETIRGTDRIPCDWTDSVDADESLGTMVGTHTSRCNTGTFGGSAVLSRR